MDCNVATVGRPNVPCMKAPSQQDAAPRGMQMVESGLCLNEKAN
ncbi:hypothetical protein SBA5_800012 [Candidatus Sulfotelmatomonas gaucii]|uniref:Uncharacterized protein n=1 Tax=Candidatus Sulfuritelmatomonas gaucii TaxID=2043161 RepID=A0A2N9M5X5_9BACT|nr:hypothetical protein SBA5_800012 [Candidatus Sulfotelmatomonas gaucii]